MSCKRSTHKSARSRSSRARVSASSDALEIFNQPEAQHDGMAQSSPSFNEASLVSGDESAERSRINLRTSTWQSVRARVINARQTGRRAVQEAWQFPAVAPRQMPTGEVNLLFGSGKNCRSSHSAAA